MYFWVSWYQPTDDCRPLTFPPNESILGWWSTGYGSEGHTLCAMVEGTDSAYAEAAVVKDWPEATVWRFCDPAKSMELGSRFPMQEWMEERFSEARGSGSP